MTVANYMYIIVVSGYYSKDDWQKWADRQILKNDEVDEWIYKIAFAKDEDKFREAIYYPKFNECYFSYNEFSYEDVIVGYYYMLYKEGRMSLDELINRLCDEDDISNAASICKEFNKILWELNVDKDKLEMRIENLLEPLKIIAEQQKKVLESY